MRYAKVTGDPRILWLFKAAAEALDEHGGKEDKPLQLVLDGCPTGGQVRLFGTHGPVGQVCYSEPGQNIATFDATEVCEYLIGTGAITSVEFLEAVPS